MLTTAEEEFTPEDEPEPEEDDCSDVSALASKLELLAAAAAAAAAATIEDVVAFRMLTAEVGEPPLVVDWPLFPVLTPPPPFILAGATEMTFCAVPAC